MILLTGGTGFVGRHLAQRFASGGRGVRILSRRPGRVALPDSVEWVLGDLADHESLRAALRGVSVVVHAAARLPSEPGGDAEFARVNADGTEALARLARNCGVRQFVLVGSSGVYGEGDTATPHSEGDPPRPNTPYQRSKLAAENVLASVLKDSGVRWTILRPTLIYGPDAPGTAAFFRDVAHRRVWLHGPARVLIQPVHCLDVVEAVQLVIDRVESTGEVFNVGGIRPIEFREWVSMIGARLGWTPVQLSLPRWTRPLAALTARAWIFAGEPPAVLLRLARHWNNSAVSIDKARRLLGFEPVTLEWGLDQTMAELRAPQPEPLAMDAQPLSDTPPRRS